MRRVAAFGLLLVASCGHAPQAAVPDAALERRLLEIAREYTAYEKLADWSRWSPIDCFLPRPSLTRSASADDPTHGRKLYYLFTRDEKSYRRGRAQPQPEGQVIVKEAWEPRRVNPGEKPDSANTVGFEEPGSPIAWYTAGPKAGLFIMSKRAGEWTYAIVSADGGRVLQSGQIESCLGCHRSAPHDSLYGTFMEEVDPMKRAR